MKRYLIIGALLVSAALNALAGGCHDFPESVFDLQGHYIGFVAPDGSWFDTHGQRQGFVQNGSVFDSHGRYLGYVQ